MIDPQSHGDTYPIPNMMVSCSILDRNNWPYHTIGIEFEVSFERRLDDESRAADSTEKKST